MYDVLSGLKTRLYFDCLQWIGKFLWERFELILKEGTVYDGQQSSIGTIYWNDEELVQIIHVNLHGDRQSNNSFIVFVFYVFLIGSFILLIQLH